MTAHAAKSDATLLRAAGMMRAAGDKERLRVMELLLVRGEMTVGEIVEATGAAQSTVSSRLRPLLAESLVARRAVGRHRIYSLADDHVRALVENVLDHADPSFSLTR